MISKDGDGIGIAFKLSQEGHTVNLWIKNPKFKKTGEGMFNRIDSWRPYLLDADLVVCDMVGFSHLTKTFKQYAKPFLGCSEFADKIELDRNYGMEIMNKAGINTPTTVEYSNPKEALQHLKKWKSAHGYIIKPSGNVSTDLTMKCNVPDIYEWTLSLYKPEQTLLVQEIIDGTEISTEGWFNGIDWITPFNHTLEEKRFMNDGLGQMTGCAGNVVLAMREPNKLIKDTLLKMTPLLRKEGYRGPFDINCIVTEKELYGLEFTPRFGFDAFEALMEGLKEPVGQFLFEIATGIKKEMSITSDYMIAVRVTRQPYPGGEEDKTSEGMPIVGINKEDLKHCFLTDVYIEDSQFKFASSDGVVMKLAARGRTIDEARNRVYAPMKHITIVNAQYRTDIGKRVDRDLSRLREWGWL